jgi:hypothetical protein
MLLPSTLQTNNMTPIESIIRELRITWGYDTTELNHIRELLEEYGAIQYVKGVLQAKQLLKSEDSE